jgi:hypothetical protein
MFVLYLLADDTREYEILTRRPRLSSSARVGWLHALYRCERFRVRHGRRQREVDPGPASRPERIYYCVTAIEMAMYGPCKARKDQRGT